MSELKTIRMPRELGEKWLAALRSGEYKQCAGVLKNTEIVVPGSEKTVTGYCCLGVLQEVAGGCEVEDHDHLPEGRQYCKLPSTTWLEKHNVFFKTLQRDEFGRLLGVSSTQTCTDNDPDLIVFGGISHKASSLNDDGDSFESIADLLERYMEYVD